jgi:hypothetical protein
MKLASYREVPAVVGACAVPGRDCPVRGRVADVARDCPVQGREALSEKDRMTGSFRIDSGGQILFRFLLIRRIVDACVRVCPQSAS